MNIDTLNLIIWVPYALVVLCTFILTGVSGYKKGLWRALLSLGGVILATAFSILLSSLFVWSVFAGCYLDVLLRYGANVWYLFLVGLPLQVCIVLWQKLKRLKRVEY